MKELGVNIKEIMERESLERSFFNELTTNKIKWRQPGVDLNYIKVTIFDKNDQNNWNLVKEKYSEIKEYV